MKWYINNQCNLLLNEYDKFCNEFIEGKISKDLFDALEIEYLKRKELFIVNLN